MAQKRSAAEQRCKEMMAFVGGYVSRNGYSPTFREIGEAVGLHSAASVSRYSHRLAQEGRISIDESKPRTISTAARLNDVETVRRRICLQLADGGKVYMDCNLQKPRAAPVTVSFDGILDAQAIKGKVGRIVRCCAAGD